MIKYIFLIIIVITIIILLYFRVKFRFWAKQPVFHIYDVWYYFFPCGIIQLDLPSREEKYNNFKDIDTIKFDELSNINKNKFVFFIQNHFLRSRELNYRPKKENIFPYLTGLDGGSVFLSLYRKKNMLMDTTLQKVKEDEKIIGTILSYPVQIIFNNGNPEANMNAYYVDYLCVDKEHRKEGIAPELIQTHHYNQRTLNKNIQVSLFKREGNLTAIIPLCLYELCGFYIKESKEFILPQDIKLIKINYKDLSYYNDFIKLNHSKFKIFISTSLANISELIKTENIYIYALIQKDTILSLYFFKKQCTYLEEENEEIVTCYASINCCKSEDIFKVGFQNALMNIIDNYPSYKLLIIENHSDNDRLIDFYSKINKLLFNIKSAYYFYNFAHHSYHSNHTLILL
jgi:GNAT superfamily N-acetyltransferase